MSNTGIVGVYRQSRPRGKPYMASLRINGKQKILGQFATPRDAIVTVWRIREQFPCQPKNARRDPQTGRFLKGNALHKPLDPVE